MSHLDFIDLMKSDFDYGGENASDYQKMKKIMAEKLKSFTKCYKCLLIYEKTSIGCTVKNQEANGKTYKSPPKVSIQ